MNVRYWLSGAVVALAIGSCHGVRPVKAGVSAIPTFAVIPAVTVKPLNWDKRILVVWPTTAKRRQLIISRGYSGDVYYGWMVANGDKLVAVFKTDNKDERDEMIASYVAYQQNRASDGVTWGIAGSVHRPPPPPPGGPPGNPGFTQVYVDQVMETAWDLDQNVVIKQVGATLP